MNVRNGIENCIVMIREIQLVKQAKEYRQVTHKDEIARESERMMTKTNWKKFQETHGLDKLFKYHKENYIKKELKAEHDEVKQREKDIVNLGLDLEALRNWKSYFMEVYSQEGDIDIETDAIYDLLGEIESKYKVNGSNNNGDD